MSKNNQQEIIRKMEDQRQRFSLRKYGVGVASVLIGLTFMGGYTVTAHADTQTAPVVAVQDSQKQSEEDTNSAANQSVADSAVSSQATASQATSDSAVKSTTATNATPAESNEVASSAKQTAQVAAIKADSSAQAQSASAASLLTNLAAQPASDSAQYNVNDWNYEGDKTNLKITGYKNIDQVSGQDIFIPNSAELRTAGLLNDGVEAQITYDTIHNLVINGAKSITIAAGNSKEDRLLAVDGGKGSTSADNNDWQTAFTSEVNSNGQANTTLKEVNLGGLDVSKVTSMTGMFRNDQALEKVTGLDTWDLASMASAKEDLSGVGQMFNNDSNLKEIQGIGDWKHTENIAYADFMFNNASSLTKLDLSKWTPTSLIWANSMFENATSLESVGDLSGWRLNNVERTNHMFSNAKSLTSVGDLSNLNLKNDTNASYMFNNAEKLNGIGNIGGWFPQGSKVTNMVQMFNDAGSLTSVGDISGWDTSNVTNMGQLFREAVSLKTIGNLDNWNVSNVTYMAGMFQGIPASSIGDLSNWDTNKVANMDYMFATTPNLTSVGNLNAIDHTNGRKGWNTTGKLEVAFRMFMGSGIKDLDVSGWKFSDTLSTNNQNTYIGPTTLANRNNAIFADLVNPATITMNGWQSDVAANLHAADFDGNQPLIVISDDSNLQNLNNDEIKADQLGKDRGSSNANVGAKGHVANTVTFVAKSELTKPVAGQQQDFVFANENALNTALNKIPTDDNLNTLDALKDKYVSKTGTYLNGQHNATQTPAYEGNYGKIAGTYSVEGKTQDVTQDLIKQKDPKLQKASAVYRVVERFPDYYKGEGTLTAQQYADAIGDSANADKYKGYVYKIKLSQPITAYRAATKNLLTGDINYDGPYSLANSDISGSIGFSKDDKSHVKDMALDNPANYTISANPTTYRSSETDSRKFCVLVYDYQAPTDTTGPSFTYDLVNGWQTDENTVTFNELPASQTFYIDYTAQTQDVTKELIDNNNYPADHMKEATYQVVERFPSTYAGAYNADGSLKDGYTKNGDHIERVIANQTVTAYQTATKNLVTGDITYSKDYNCKYVTFKTTTNKTVDGKKLWDYPKDPNDITYIGDAPVDTPAGYNISAPTNPYVTSEKDADDHAMLTISYNSKDHAFNYDFMVGTSDGNANKQVMFSTLPASYNFYIDYTADKQNGKISYITEKDGKEVEVGTTPLTGKTGEEVTITPVAPDGYVLVPNQNIPATETATADGIPDVTVKVVPATIEVTPDDPKNPSDKLPDGTKTATTYPDNGNYPAGVSKDDLNKTVTRKITVTKPDGTSTVITQEVKFTRTATVNLANGKVEYSDWTVDGSDSLDSYTAPEIPGYTASGIVPEINNVKDTDSFDDVTINYTANEQTGKISYVDENGKEISSTELTGKTGEEVTVKPEAPAGWKIVSGQDIPSEVTATADGIPTVTVKVEHATVVVQPDDPKTPSDKLPDNPNMNYPEGVSKDDLNKTITRTIKITKPDGTVIDKTQTLSFERTATVDEVTGEVTYGNWTPVKGGSASFGEVDVPEIPGYTPTQSNVPAQSLTNDEITNWQDTSVNVTYTADPQSTEIIYQTIDGKQVGTTTLNGVTDQTIKVSPEAPEGYWIDKSKQHIPATYTFKASDNHPITVIVVKKEDGTLPPTTDDKDVALIIQYQDKDGKVVGTQIVTGKVGANEQIKLDIPDGYYSSQSTLDHTFKANDSVEIISVTKKEEQIGTPTTDDKKMAVIVEFKDQDGKVVGTQVIEGDEGTTDTFELNIPAGYYGSNDELTHTFKPGDSMVTVNVTKKEEGTLPPTTDDKDVAVLIEYTDPSGKVIKTDIISGKPGSTIQVPSDLPAGYQTTGDVPTTYTIGKGDHQVVVINVTPINADSGSTQPDQPSSGSDTPSSSANPGSDIPAQSGASDSASAQPDQPSSGSEMPSSSADSATDSNSAAVTPSEPTSTATASSAVASDAPAASASAAITGQTVVASATPTTAASAQSQATQRNLPQTGNDSRKATSIAGLALASLAGILGFGAKRKKEN